MRARSESTTQRKVGNVLGKKMWGEHQKWLQMRIKDKKQPGVSSFICLEVVYMRFCVCIIFLFSNLTLSLIPNTTHRLPPQSLPFVVVAIVVVVVAIVVVVVVVDVVVVVVFVVVVVVIVVVVFVVVSSSLLLLTTGSNNSASRVT